MIVSIIRIFYIWRKNERKREKKKKEIEKIWTQIISINNNIYN